MSYGTIELVGVGGLRSGKSGRGSKFNSSHSCRGLPLYSSFVGVEKGLVLVFGVGVSEGFGGGDLGGGILVWGRDAEGLRRFFGDSFLNLLLLCNLIFCICWRLVVGEVMV